MKITIAAEAKAWRVMYGRHMNTKYLTLMEKIMEQIEDLHKRLSRPIKDLDDVRQAMSTLKELRENEIEIDSALGPVEVSVYIAMYQDSGGVDYHTLSTLSSFLREDPQEENN